MSAQPTLDIRAQLDELRLLKDGWLEGEGLSPPATGLAWLQHAFARHFPDGAPPPHLYPTETGGVQAEWSIGSMEISLDLNLDTRSGEWHALDTEAGEVEERTLDGDDDSRDWKWLARRIEAMVADDR